MPKLIPSQFWIRYSAKVDAYLELVPELVLNCISET